jgi:ADP-heptose:LPS heptosyltransferase
MNELTPANCKTLGTGSEKSVCLFAIVNGIGDAVHMLPALSQMLSDGYELTVYCRAFHVPIYEAINVQHVIACESESEIGISWAAENEHLFGSWYSLHSWGGWYCDSHGHHDTGTMQEFADIVGTTLPESFSWIDTLKPERGLTDGKYILFAPDSAESWRSLSLEQANEFYTALQKQGNVVWLAQPPACVSEAFIREYVNEILRISTPEDAQRELDAFRNREHARITAAMKNKFIARSW